MFTRAVAAILALAFAMPCAQAAAPPVSDDIPIVLLVDLSNGQTLYAREEKRRFVPASVTKVMTAYTAFEMIEVGELILDHKVLYSRALERAWYGEGSTMFLRAGDTPTIAQLLMGITTVSGNDASMALALDAKGSLEAWLSQMNANASALGMADTHFGSPNGYPDGGETYTTAHDLVLLGRALTQDHAVLYQRFFGQRALNWGGFAQQNHDPVSGRVAGADGIKTGFTNEAGNTFLGSAVRDGRRLIMVIAGAPTQEERDDGARALLEWGFAHFTPQRVARGDTVLGRALVQGGTDDGVGLVARDDVMIDLPAGVSRDDLTFSIAYRGPVSAPIDVKDRIATLKISHDEIALLETPLFAHSKIDEANVLQRIGNAIARWFG